MLLKENRGTLQRLYMWSFFRVCIEQNSIVVWVKTYPKNKFFIYFSVNQKHNLIIYSLKSAFGRYEIKYILHRYIDTHKSNSVFLPTQLQLPNFLLSVHLNLIFIVGLKFNLFFVLPQQCYCSSVVCFVLFYSELFFVS